MSSSPRPRRSAGILLAVAALLCGLLTTAATASAPAASAATAVPPTPTGLPSGVEELASYVGANSCDASTKPGSAALGALLVKTYPGTSYGSARACASDSLATSEHYDGRAVDWMANSRNATQKAQANAAVAWMLAKDKAGNPYAMARRLGVMYLIWNNRSWSAYRPAEGWKEYNGCLAASKASSTYDTTCHRNHVHISLSWAGAMKRSSYWSKKVAAPEYGPCRTWMTNWASPSTTANHTRCQSLAPVQALPTATTLGKRLVSISGMYVKQGSTGPAVTSVQSAIGASATGSFTSSTTSALVAWQKRNSVPATGVTDARTWRALIRAHAAQPIALGLDSTIDSDLLSLNDGRLTLSDSASDPYGRVLATNWSGVNGLVAPGDFNGDAYPDLISRTAAGVLRLHRGTGNATFAPPAAWGPGWNVYSSLFSPGDFNGDGRADVIGVRPDGAMYLYKGNGKGGFSGTSLVGTGWNSYDLVLSPGDFTGDGRADLVVHRPDDTLWLYKGNGKGGWVGTRTQLTSGLPALTSIVAAGDLNGDQRSDLLGLTTGGRWLAWYGTGTGALTSGTGRQVSGSDWSSAGLVVGVR
ncbi:hypothetical protein ASD62_04560 [Phycicoccus sp. Root563]|uniref:FG-GAP repeat domain-containing protein n=1 Tax=Phycicoccus sp. Root563 TaxID=1736562 RepID=UPI000702C169|nr:VCBS repeat-containing protein [Phycicoccus sp. Root563]KQZ88689.1 hypothetical protein ASD62_04560 [Phycicoccus sp. Root563]